MSDKRLEREIRQVAEVVTGMLTDAVRETIEQRSPEPARDVVRRLTDTDQRTTDEEGGGPGELMATLALIRWGALAREELAAKDGWIEQVLAWIEDALGRRYRARARYTTGALRGEDEAAECMVYRSALQDDFLPSLVWLIAGTVAVYGGGDVVWLRDLERDSLAEL